MTTADLIGIKSCGECPFWMKTSEYWGECWRPNRKRWGMRRTTDRRCRELRKLTDADLESKLTIPEINQ